MVVLALVGQATGVGGAGAGGRAAGLTELLELLGSIVLCLGRGVGVVQRSLVATYSGIIRLAFGHQSKEEEDAYQRRGCCVRRT